MVSGTELGTQIELARRAEELVEREGLNERRRAEEAAAAAMIATAAGAERAAIEAERDARAIDTVQAARLRAETERARINGGMATETLLALALRELAGEIGKVEHLTITPDLLAPLLARALAGAGSADGVGG